MTANKVTECLNKVLADTFILYFKTHSFHWNVEGAQFKALHDLFDEQYNELWIATDEIAERIRALGEYSPNSWASMVPYTELSEENNIPDAITMIKQLASDHKSLAKSLKPYLKIAQETEDEVTADLFITRMSVHEKTAWMLTSLAQ
ncbi:MAG: DNA starvation/stationary phase protection protein [Alphaproteobacteria bacterium]|nr:DNA starvation/stationary phase protection protein [Alphaproteobacteria bacterium]